MGRHAKHALPIAYLREHRRDSGDMCTVRRIPDPSRVSYCQAGPSESRPLWSVATNL